VFASGDELSDRAAALFYQKREADSNARKWKAVRTSAFRRPGVIIPNAA
jgi:hypothetical protein